jgi:hypothetical protein
MTKTMVVLKSYAHVGGTLRTSAEGPIEVDAEWAESAREAGLLSDDFVIAGPESETEAEAAAAEEAANIAQAETAKAGKAK